jgi:hypothetical protein
MRELLDETIGDLEKALDAARESGEDISADYSNREDSRGYDLQVDLRLTSRSLSFDYYTHVVVETPNIGNYTKRVLELLRDTTNLFGKHPHSQIIKDRLTDVVEISCEHGMFQRSSQIIVLVILLLYN